MRVFAVIFTLIVAVFWGLQGCTAERMPDNGGTTELSGDQAADPEAATGWTERDAVYADSFMVSAANPHATKAGLRVLEQGGTAIDAAVAVQAMLTLVEPQSSGIGGGAFILYWDNSEQQLYSIDARETAPAAATPELFLDEDGNAAGYLDAVVGGRSVGAPGVLRGLESAHSRYGKTDWADLFKDTISLAESGFEVSPRLAQLVQMDLNPGLRQHQASREFFFPGGEPLQEGDTLTNHELADTLLRIAEQGADALYYGDIADSIVAAVQHSEMNPGLLSLEDLASYEPVWRQPVCGPYRAYEICSMGPPSSGGITMLQILGLLEGYDLAAEQPLSTDFVHLFSQASRLAFADRNFYIADEDYVQVPLDALLEADYLAARRELIELKTDMGTATPGDMAMLRAEDDALELPNTSHIAIVDAAGNAVSMTTTIEFGFGSSVMTRGFLLNNQLTDFSRTPERNGQPVANRVEPGKRPRSSMAPVISFNQETGQPAHVIGSPGGPRIINYVTLSMIGLIDWGMNVQEAINMPRITNLNSATALEADSSVAELAHELEARGHTIEVRALNSGIHGIVRLPDGQLEGGADPRREGVAQGN